MPLFKHGVAGTLAVTGAALGILSAGQALAANSSNVAGEYLVKYKSSSFVARASLRALPGMRLLSDNSTAHLLKVTVAPSQEARVLVNLMNNPEVAYVVPNATVHAFRAPITAQMLKDQWALKKVNAEAAWAKAGNKGSKNVLIGVIDTGVDYNHESLQPNMVQGYNFRDNNNDPMDKTSPGGNPGHGTHCSGIIGGTGLVDGGIEGISPTISIMPLRFLGEDGSGDLDGAVKAIDYAIAHKVQIISASWGATIDASGAQPLIEALKRADQAGVIFVAAAANDGANNDEVSVYPANANLPNMIVVAATDSSDSKPSWSNYGVKTVHVASPGDNIMSSLPGNSYGNLSGTSMATPLVAGMVGFLKAQDATLTGVQSRALLQLTGAKVNLQIACHCRVDALAATNYLLSKKVYIAPAAGSINAGETLQFNGTNGQAPYTYTVADASVGTISATGLFTAVKNGTTSVTVKDATGATSTSLDINVGASTSNPPDNGGGGGDDGSGGGGGFPFPPGGGGGDNGGGGGGGGGLPGGGSDKCPFDAQTCQAVCQMQPTLPFCKQ